MAKKKKCPECPPEGAPSYMLTYGDMMTLLVTFFVLLISYSSMNEVKFKKAMTSLKGALGVLKADQGARVISDPVPMYEFRPNDFNFKVEQLIKQIEEITEKSGTHEMIRVERSKDQIRFSISNPMLYNSGSSDLKTQSDEVLEQIAKVLAMVPFDVRVEGHTDNIPIHTAKYPSNWELSNARALAVVKKFIQLGINPSRFQAIGFAEFRPVATNNTSAGRSQNRRVEIFVNLKQETTDSSIDLNLPDFLKE